MSATPEKSLAALLDERRTFPPPEEFRHRANANDPAIYDRALRNPEAFWASEAEKLDWFTPWQKVLEWNAPWAKWFVGGKLNVPPLIRDMVSRQEIAEFIAPRRPPRTQHSYAFKSRAIGSPPIVKQVIQLRIEMVGGRIPRLHEKIIDVGLIDRADGGVRVRISGQ